VKAANPVKKNLYSYWSETFFHSPNPALLLALWQFPDLQGGEYEK
jgi:hypothetical protein